MRYVSRSTECEAMQWTTMEPPHALPEVAAEIVAWVNANGGEARYEPETSVYGCTCNNCQHPARIAIRTLNDEVYVKPGNYVRKGTETFTAWRAGPDGKPEAWQCRYFYPCDPGTFEHHWEAQDTPEPTETAAQLPREVPDLMEALQHSFGLIPRSATPEPNAAGDIRCHHCGEYVNVRCWNCGTPRGQGPRPSPAAVHNCVPEGCTECRPTPEEETHG